MTHILQRREEHGLIRTIARSPHEFDQKETLQKYGPGYYADKETSPRFHVSWKGWLGDPTQQGDVVKKLSKEVVDLKEKTNYLVLGEAILGVGEIAGFALTATNLIGHGQRLNRAEAIITAINQKSSLGFVCPQCYRQLADPLDTFCGNCGSKLDWTDARRVTIPTTQLCPYCSWPVRLDQRFCTQCGKLLNDQNLSSVGYQFVPAQ